MSNLTVVIDDDLLRQARIKALQQGTSVNEICRQAIERFARADDAPESFMTQFRAVARRIQQQAAASGAASTAHAAWTTRDAMYDEALAERLPTLWSTLPPPAAKRRK